MTSSPIARTVYIVSDSTGITAETFSQSVLSQFEEVQFKPVRLPYVDTLEKPPRWPSASTAAPWKPGSRPLCSAPSSIRISWPVFARRTAFS